MQTYGPAHCQPAFPGGRVIVSRKHIALIRRASPRAFAATQSADVPVCFASRRNAPWERGPQVGGAERDCQDARHPAPVSTAGPAPSRWEVTLRVLRLPDGGGRAGRMSTSVTNRLRRGRGRCCCCCTKNGGPCDVLPAATVPDGREWQGTRDR